MNIEQFNKQLDGYIERMKKFKNKGNVAEPPGTITIRHIFGGKGVMNHIKFDKLLIDALKCPRSQLHIIKEELVNLNLIQLGTDKVFNLTSKEVSKTSSTLKDIFTQPLVLPKKSNDDNDNDNDDNDYKKEYDSDYDVPF